MRKNLWIIFGFIIALTALAVFIDIPKSALSGEKVKALLGLDLQGGTELIYQADLSQSTNKTTDLTNLKNVFRNRIDRLGVGEPTIQTTGTDRILIELPGIRNIDEAVQKIGETYELVFMTQSTAEEGGLQLQAYSEDYTYPGYWKATDLTGRNLIASKTDATFQNSQSSVQSEPVVSLTFDSAGKEKFAKLTKENLNKQIAIVLDNRIISAPNVQVEITDGQAIITGQKDIKEAQELASRLKEGSLPISAQLVAQKNIGASLGEGSLKKSIVAAIIGFLVLTLFMLIYYKFPGLLAIVALAIYATLSMALFKIIPVTLSLAGIAGFILSVGMAVDANILIFERMKEELKSGKDNNLAIRDGFVRAWSSIRDSNFSSIITCIILYVFGSGSVRGFALTLLIGVIVSMFTAVTVTRTFMLLISQTNARRWLNV
ncbi:MAG: protein translocase subunit SecD [Patescibacteria group bacterium]